MPPLKSDIKTFAPFFRHCIKGNTPLYSRGGTAANWGDHFLHGKCSYPPGWWLVPPMDLGCLACGIALILAAA